jgi:hypothetical protein
MRCLFFFALSTNKKNTLNNEHEFSIIIGDRKRKKSIMVVGLAFPEILKIWQKENRRKIKIISKFKPTILPIFFMMLPSSTMKLIS